MTWYPAHDEVRSSGGVAVLKEASWITSVHAFERWCYTVDELLEALAVAESVMAFGLADEIRWAISEHVIAEE